MDARKGFNASVFLTKEAIDRAKADPSGPFILWDSGSGSQPGFRVRIRPTGRKTYELRYRDVWRRQKLIVIGEHGRPWTVKQAREKARELWMAATLGGESDPAEKRKAAREALTVADLADLYLAQGPADKPLKRASSWNVDRYSMERHAKPLLGSRIARELKAEHLSEWQAQVAAGKTAFDGPSGKARGRLRVRGGPGAAARAMRSMAAMLAWAQSRGLVKKNVAAGVQKLQDGRRERYLSPDETARLWAAVDSLQGQTGGITEGQADAFRLLMLTGARRSEIINLSWSEFHSYKRILILPPLRNKTGGSARPRTIALSPQAFEILERRRHARGGSPFVFPAARDTSPAGSFAWAPMSPPKAAWTRVLKAAGVTDASFHVLRHTMASLLVASGASLYETGKALGHTKAETTQRYAHLQDQHGASLLGAAGTAYTGAQSESEARPLRKRPA